MHNSGLQAHKLSATHLLASPDDNRNPLNDSTGITVVLHYSFSFLSLCFAIIYVLLWLVYVCNFNWISNRIPNIVQTDLNIICISKCNNNVLHNTTNKRIIEGHWQKECKKIGFSFLVKKVTKGNEKQQKAQTITLHFS